MTIIDDIRRDREARSTLPWRAEQPHFANGWWVVFTNPDTDGTIDESGDGGFEEVTARRIARVPQLEEIALAAGELAKVCAEYEASGGRFSVATQVALHALRKAVETAE